MRCGRMTKVEIAKVMMPRGSSPFSFCRSQARAAYVRSGHPAWEGSRAAQTPGVQSYFGGGKFADFRTALRTSAFHHNGCSRRGTDAKRVCRKTGDFRQAAAERLQRPLSVLKPLRQTPSEWRSVRKPVNRGFPHMIVGYMRVSTDGDR